MKKYHILLLGSMIITGILAHSQVAGWGWFLVIVLILILRGVDE